MIIKDLGALLKHKASSNVLQLHSLATQVYHNNTNPTLLLKNSQEIDKQQMNLLF